MNQNNNSVLRQFAKYVSFNIFGMVGISCYILADTFFVARGVGAEGLTALNLALPAYSLMQGLGLMVGMGGATRYAIAKASGDRAGRKNSFSYALFLALCLSLPFFCVGLFAAHPLAELLGADAGVIDLTVDYLRTLLLFAPAFFGNNLLLCFLRNDDAPRLAMASMLAGSISNIFLDYLFIFPMGMGMFGAAFATGIAPFIGMGVMSMHFWRRKNGFSLHRVLPQIKQALDLFSLGSSALVLELSSGVVLLTFNMLLLHLAGNVGVAAYGVVANIALVVIAIFTGISQGMQPVLSGCYGRGEAQNVKTIYRAALLTAACFAVGVYLVGSLFAEGIVSLFNKEGNAALADLAVGGIRIYFLSFLFASANVVTAAALSAVARPAEGFFLSILRGLLVMIPMALLLSALFGVQGVWASVPVTEAAVAMLIPLVLRQKKKKELP